MSDRRGKRRNGPGRKLIRVDMACNDPDNGLFAGRVPYIEIGELELAAKGARPPRLVLLPDDRFRLAGKTWRIKSAKSGVGNWCWDSFFMSLDETAEFLNWLWGRKLYDVDAGTCALFDWWKKGTGPMEKRLLCMLIEEAVR